MSEPGTAAIDREPGSQSADAERLTEAGITEALIECLRDCGYGEYELTERSPQFAVQRTRIVADMQEGRQKLSVPDQVSISLYVKRPGRPEVSQAAFYFEDPYPENRDRRPFLMLREYESSVSVVEPEKRPPMGIISAGVDHSQERVIRDLIRAYEEKFYD